MKNFTFLFIAALFACVSCTQKTTFKADFNNTNNRVWVGKDFWSVPLEDWKIEDGKLHCVGTVIHSRVNVLTHILKPGAGNFEVSASFSLQKKGNNPGSAGFIIGAFDKEDPDVRAACYFGKGINAGVSENGYAFLKDQKTDLPQNFNWQDFSIEVEGNGGSLEMIVADNAGLEIGLNCEAEDIQGLVVLVNNFDLGEKEKPGKSNYSFDNLEITGSKVIEKKENSFGPVLWTMHTLSKKTLKLMALLPPLGESDNQQVSLQLNKEGEWQTVDTKIIEPDSHTAVFKIENWDDSQNGEYRVEYIEKGKDGEENPAYFEGTIRKDPVDRPLKVAGLTCQFHFGFPYTPLVSNLQKLDPDLLYFSGDQIYEGNGGYGIKRQPADVAILSYLGKYYMFGWAFRDAMRDRPTICTPDDHDVFHGNLWGEGGKPKPGDRESDTRGFIEPVEMVNVVNRTQCGQLPDPYDPTPIEQGMSVWYTGLIYGRVSFAIISDRIFKTGPEAVSDWEGRHDHMKEPRKDLSFLDKPGVEMLGERQLKFLNDWKMDWDGADQKVLLTQTVFANVATHHGSYDGYLYGDLDSGGWPKSGRDKVIKIMRQTGAFQICGDQHLPSMVQYGIQNYRDAGWCYCTPAIAVMYLRWFRPDEMGYPVLDRPEHNYPNTGKYTDAFGNMNYVYAIGNPGENVVDRESRYSHAQIRSSGFGMVTFDQVSRDVKVDAWRFLADVENPNPVRDQFPGWPVTINQYDNFGEGATNYLPTVEVNKPNQLIEVTKTSTGDLIRIFRMKGNSMQVGLHHPGTFTIKINDTVVGTFDTKPNSNPEIVKVEI